MTLFSFHEYPKYDPLPFMITVRIHGRSYRLKVQQTLSGIGIEQFEITANNKKLKFETNRPMIERRGLKNFPWDWRLIEGELKSESARQAIIQALEQHLRGNNNPLRRA